LLLISYVRHCRTAVNDRRANLYVYDFYLKYCESNFIILIVDQNIELILIEVRCANFKAGLDIFSELVSKIPVC